MLAGVPSQTVAAGHVECIKVTIIAYNHSKYVSRSLAHGYGVCLMNFMASYVLKKSLQRTSDLVLAAGDMLPGTWGQKLSAAHMKCIKLTPTA